jgi:hypothetical protein
LIADLWACFEGQGYGQFEDIDTITSKFDVNPNSSSFDSVCGLSRASVFGGVACA